MKKLKMPPKQMSKEEFEFETRSVILNFLSLLPTQDLSLTESQTSSSSGSDKHKTVLKKTNSVPNENFVSFDSQHSKEEPIYFASLERFDSKEDRQKILSDNEDVGDGPKFNYRLVRQGATDLPILDKPDDQAFKSADLPLIPLEKAQRSASPRRPNSLAIIPDIPDLSPPVSSTIGEPHLLRKSNSHKNDRIISTESDDQTDAIRTAYSHIGSGGMPTIPEGQRVSRLIQHQQGTASRVKLERQDSHVSSISNDLDSSYSDISSVRNSSRSKASSARLSVADLKKYDIQSLVRTNTLPPIALPLKEELTREFEELHNFGLYGPAPTPDTCLTPESEVARRIAIIGDIVEAEFGPRLAKALGEVMKMPREKVTYDVMKEIAEQDGLLSDAMGWKQVAVLMVFSQKITMGLLRKGERGIGKLLDFTVRLIEDKAAAFILKQGGWAGIQDIEMESPGYIPDLTPPLSPDINQSTNQMRGAEGGATSSDHLDNRVTFAEDSKNGVSNWTDHNVNSNESEGETDIIDNQESENYLKQTREETINKVKREILIMRQLSEQIESERKHNHRSSVAKMALLVGGVTVLTLGVVLFMKSRKGHTF